MTARETFKEAAQAAVRLHSRNIGDRGLNGDRSALHVGPTGSDGDPGLLDILADIAESSYGDAPQGRPKRGTS